MHNLRCLIRAQTRYNTDVSQWLNVWEALVILKLEDPESQKHETK